MKQIYSRSIFRRMLVSFMCFVSFALSAQENVHEGVLRIKIGESSAPRFQNQRFRHRGGVVLTGIQPFDAVSSQLQVFSIKPVFKYNEKHAARHRKHGLDRWFEIRFKGDISPLNAVMQYANVSAVELAEPAYKVKPIDNGKPIQVLTAEDLMNDPYLKDQWHYQNLGVDDVAIAGSDINLKSAWTLTTGSPNVIVSIVDGGIEHSHPDLQGNMWVNDLEKNGVPGVDDDNNGYVDDIYGYNFAEDQGSIRAHVHGTHVAGTVAASNNNDLGVSGVAGGSGQDDGARLMSCQIFSDYGSGNYANAIVYGADNGAVISQNSWGYNDPEVYEQVVLDAIDYFIAEAGRYESSPMQGGVVIFASGNNSQEANYYPGAYKSCISVSAIGPNFKATSYTNRGEWVSLSAPGGEITMGQKWGVLSTYTEGRYAYMDGTSMACPHVSGIAALVVSKFGGPSFTNSELRQRLVTGVRNIEAYNPNFIGKLGTGTADAYLALSENRNSAPEAVSDFMIEGASQNYIMTSWSATADADDTQAYSYTLFYSTETFTQDGLTNVPCVEAGGTNVEVGQKITHELRDLLPLTTYYMAVQAQDRWGNKSPLSEVKSVKTNKGPTVEIDTQDIVYEITMPQEPTITEGFTLYNTGEGVLNWEAQVRHKGQQFATIHSNQPLAPQVDLVRETAVQIGKKELPKAHGFAKSNEVNKRKEFSYGESLNYVIGESDINKSNTAIVYYQIMEDFNLTSINAMLRHDAKNGPILIEIIKGNRFSRDAIIYTQEFNGHTTDATRYDIKLDEQLFFSTGTPFFVIIHVPKGNLYPLGIAMEKEYPYSDYNFYSTDGGKTTMLLEDALQGGFTDPEIMVWDVQLKSTNGHFGEYLTFEKSSGDVMAGESVSIPLTAHGESLINGTYKANVVVKSNDVVNPEVRKEIQVKVTGHKPKLDGPRVVNYNDVEIGNYKLMDIELENIGLGSFSYAQTTSSNPDFVVVSPISTLGAMNHATMRIRFKPTKEGNQSSEIKLVSHIGENYSFSVTGIGVSKSGLDLSSDIFAIPKQTATSSFEMDIPVTLSNSGGYPIDYTIGCLSDPVSPTLDSCLVNKLGYRVSPSQDDIDQFEWIDISMVGTEVMNEVIDVMKFKEISLGFNFPFYGEKFDTLYLNQIGVLSTSDTVNVANCRPLSPYGSCMSGYGAISLFGGDIAKSRESKIYIHSNEQRFVVTYENVLIEECNGVLTAQIVLFANGDIRLAYKDVDANVSGFVDEMFIGTKDIKNEYPVAITCAEYPLGTGQNNIVESLSSMTQFDIKNPGVSILQSTTSNTGTLQVGESREVVLKVLVEGLHEGFYHQTIPVIFGSKTSQCSYITLAGQIEGGGVSNVKYVGEPTILLGDVFRTSDCQLTLRLDNLGSAQGSASARVSSDKIILSEEDKEFVINPSRSVHVPLTINTDEIGALKETVTFEIDGQEVVVPIHLDVLSEPVLSLSTDKIVKVMQGGTIEEQVVELQNTGQSALNLGVEDNGIVSLPSEVLTTADKITYSVTRNDEGELPVYQWESFYGVADHYSPLHQIETGKNNVEVAIPFAFNYFGQEYTKMYIHYSGMVSFSPFPQADDELTMVPSPIIPTKDAYNNLLAPMAGYHNPNPMIDPSQSGMYYYHTPDYVMVEWTRYKDMFGICPFDYYFQVFLYKNGNIVFQYKNVEEALWTPYTVGIENADGSDGYPISNGPHVITKDMAISFMPVKHFTLDPQENISLNFQVDASKLGAGSYQPNILIHSNQPNQEIVTLPVTLTVEGEPEVSFKESVNFGDLMITWLDDQDPFDPYKGMPSENLEISNSGFDIYMLNAIKTEDNNVFQGLITVDMPSWGGQVVEMEIPFEEYEYFHEQYGAVVVATGGNIQARVILKGDAAGQYTNKVTFVTSVGEYQIPLQANLISPPMASVDKKSLVVIAKGEGFTTQESVVLTNEAEDTPLTYQAQLVFEREIEPASQQSAVQARLSMGQVATSLQSIVNRSARATDSQSVIDFNRTVSYDEPDDRPSNFLGFGPQAALTVGVRYQVPADGFNLTHVKTWYMPGNQLNSTLYARVRAGGETIAQSKIIAQGQTEYVIEEPDNVGEYVIIPLDEPIHLYPNEEVYLEISYPLGVPFPQGHTTYDLLPQIVFGRYFYSDGQSWQDIAESPLMTAKLMTSLLEKDYEANYWLELDNATGEVKPKSNNPISLTFRGDHSQQAQNKAKVLVLTNDPSNDTISFDVQMTMNQGPEIRIAQSSYHTNEMQPIEIPMTVVDHEGDSYDVQVEAPEFITMTGVDGEYILSVTPGYDDAGMHTVRVEAIDAYNESQIKEVYVEVINTNREPESSTSSAIEVNLSQYTVEYAKSTFFTDPDGDDLKVTLGAYDKSKIRIFETEHSFIIYGLQEGICLLSMQAADPSGATCSCEVEVKILPGSGMESLQQGDVRISPTPVKDVATLHLNGLYQTEASVKIFNVAGVCVLETIVTGDRQTIHVDHLPTGVYYVWISDKTSSHQIEMMKE